jgi:hypothetical protein
LLRHGIGRELLIENPYIFLAIYKAMSENRDEDMWPYFIGCVSIFSDWTLGEEPFDYVNLLNEMTSTQIDIFPCSLEICNHSWNFETVVGSHGVTVSGKYAFEYQLGTTGIIQLGWASNQFTFNQRGGYGVGDGVESYAFDGSRVRKWHGRDVGEETYGASWSPHDVVTCLIDLDDRTVSFCINGHNFGIAFTDLDSSKIWYPAISLTSEQYGKFRFGGSLDKLLFCPTNYSPIPFEKEDISCGNIQSPEIMLTKGDDIDHTPTVITNVEREPILSISMFFEVTVQIHFESIKVIQVGFITKSKILLFAAYHSPSKQMFFISSNHDFNDAFFYGDYLQQILDQEKIDFLPWNVDGKGLKIFGRACCNLENGSIIGAGINDEDGFCFFSHNGIIIGPRITVHEFEVVPYLRNIPRYLLNFGKHDYATQEANICFSPSVLVLK